MADRTEEKELEEVIVPSVKRTVAIDVAVFLAVGLLTSIAAFLFLEMAEWPWQEKVQLLLGDTAFKEWVQVGILFLVYTWLAALTSSKWISAALVLVATGTMNVANTLKLSYRSEPVYPSDFFMLSDVPFLADMAGKRVLLAVVGFGAIIGLATWFLFRFEKKNHQRIPSKVAWTTRGVLFALSSVFLFQVFQFNQHGNFIREAVEPHTRWIKFRQGQNYRENGFLLGFLYNLNAPAMEEPTNYSKATIEALHQKYKHLSDEINAARNGELDANILFVMNESFSDPLNLSSLTVSGDPISSARKLRSEHMGGSILTQSYGGGTANIEFSALTGVSMEPLAPSLTTPFTQLTTRMKELPSIPRQLKEKGYQTTAIHPHDTTMYKRVDVYDYLGFEEFISRDDLASTMKYENNQYIADLASYQEAMDVMQNSSGNDFIHIVTMHNHVDYIDNYQELEYQVEGVEDPENSISQYYQGLSYSDKDLQALVEKMDALEEKTLLVFWGDHLPGIYNEDIFTKEQSLDMYETPLVIYSNFADMSREDSDMLISPIYFMNHVLKLTDAPVSPYTALLMELEQVLPAFENGRYVETDAETVKASREDLSPEAKEVLEDYSLLLYDVTTGENYGSSMGFFESVD